ncbi:MAG: hypothetical protein ACFCUI_06980 [Bernardetiaceae bacterium]
MRLFAPDREETLFELDEMRSMNGIFVGKLITGMAFAYSMLWMPWFLRFIFAFISVSVLVPLGKEYFFRQIRGLRITDAFLELRRGRTGRRVQRIHFKDVRRIELIEKQQPRHRSPERGQRRRTLFDQEPGQRIFHPETKCLITLSSGNTIEIEAGYFEEGDFELFLENFERTYAKAIGTSSPQKRLNKRFQINAAATKTMPPLTAAGRRYEELLKKNRNYLNSDLALKRQLENEREEAYRSIYQIADGLDMNRSQAKVCFSFKNNDGSTAYILQDNYLPNLDEENIITGQNLIEAYHKNLSLVEMRIAYYKKIEAKLQAFMFQEKTRAKLKALARSLQNIQEQNTERSTAHSSMLDENDIDIENRILSQLEDLSDEVHGLEDLEKAIMLNEHISLFKD